MDITTKFKIGDIVFVGEDLQSFGKRIVGGVSISVRPTRRNALKAMVFTEYELHMADDDGMPGYADRRYNEEEVCTPEEGRIRFEELVRQQHLEFFTPKPPAFPAYHPTDNDNEDDL